MEDGFPEEMKSTLNEGKLVPRRGTNYKRAIMHFIVTTKGVSENV